jgi:DNA-binding LacI/PurR family transcriptional regulator
MSKERKLTIRDVAMQAGVSVSTVSLYFNNPEKVGKTTLGKIEKAAKDLNFTPNNLAKRLALNSSETIAVCAFAPGSIDVTGNFFFPILKSITEQAKNNSHSLHFLLEDISESNSFLEKRFKDFINQRLAEGIIIYSYRTPTLQLFSRLIKENYPFVLVNGFVEDIGSQCVAVDNQGGIIQAMEYLASLGHKRIGFIQGPTDQQDANERRIAYDKSVQRLDLCIEKDLIVKGDYFTPSGYEAMKHFWKMAKRPTAILSSNDLMAVGVFNYCRKEGIVIPDDLSVIGFDDMDVASLLTPPLSTVRQPFEELGKAAADLLYKMINNKEIDQNITKLETTLIVRESCSIPLTIETNENKEFVTVEKRDDIWWFANLKGEKFVSLGINHVEPHLWLAPYNRDFTLSKYGKDFVDKREHFNPNGLAVGSWINKQLKTCDYLGFNSFGKHVHSSISINLFRDKIYHVVSLDTASLGGWQQDRGLGSYPDVFSHEFRDKLEQKIKYTCSRCREYSNMLGYVYSDVPCWEIEEKYTPQRNDPHTLPWVWEIIQLDDFTSGKQRWIQHLKDRYASAEAAARSWGIVESSTYGITWEDLTQLQTWDNPVDTEKTRSDQETFMSIILENWYQLHHQYIRKYDPNHLIFGDKIKIESFRSWLFPSLKKYVDVILFQSYNNFNDDIDMMNWVHMETGKPLLNGDGSFGYINPSQSRFKVKGHWTGARNPHDVGEMYSNYLRSALALPYFIGWHHCGFLEQWDDSERGDVHINENGFMDPFENLYTDFTDQIRCTNKQAVKLHSLAVNNARREGYE